MARSLPSPACMWTVLAATVTMTLTVRGPSPSGAASPPAAPLPDAQRERTARKLVKKIVKPWVRSGDRLTVRTAIVGFNGDARNPITGSGPVEVFVRQRSKSTPSGWDRFVRRFDPFGHRRFVVDVDRHGAAHLLHQESLAVQRKAGRLVLTVLPVREVVNHAIYTKEGRESLAYAGAGLLSLGVNQVAAGALLSWGAKTTLDGLRLRSDARDEAFDATVEWASRKGRKGDWPNLVTTYSHYRAHLARKHPGTLPVSMLTFAELLRAQQF